MNRAARRTKDRKRSPGACINHTLTLKPLGMKTSKYEMDARAALLAMKHNVHNEQHLIDLFVLADICERLSDEHYIKVHAASVKSLIEKSHDAGLVFHFDYVSIEPSADVLIEFFRKSKNSDIARVCREAAK